MSEIAIASEMTGVSEKPVPTSEESKFPPFPDPKDEDFDEDIPEEERNFYRTAFKDLNCITSRKLHCTACDRHLGCSARNDSRMRTHPMLRTLVCQTCHTFYNSGEFEKGDDGSELYCRWCGQGGQVYCCSDCPHVFCAKCIKRNLGTPKIKEIEQLDDWKCFKCNNRCLWDLRALCWAVIRYCDLKNKITYEVEDPVLKEFCQKSCAQDFSECCKNKMNRRKEKLEKKKESENAKSKKSENANLAKLPPTIQVKKFASISMEEQIKPEKKAQKRPASPKNKGIMKNSVSLPNKMMNHMNMPSLPKKIRMPSSTVINPVRFNNDRKIQIQPPTNFSYARIRPKPPMTPMMYNGFGSAPAFTNDNINLSLESLTQGLDMSAMAALAAGPSQNDDVVCTPDFPLEPLCEVTEDPGDDDVQCITPGPVAAPKVAPAPLAPPVRTTLPDLHPDNIVQMTDNDVTVNAATGGLKFRVDPQTLSSNKMYRLPDGRIFAINANPNMPGGYSATIVAVTDSSLTKVPPRGTTFAAKLSAVPANATSTPKFGNRNQSPRNAKRSPPKSAKASRNSTEKSSRPCDLNVPIEWYRFNLVDAIDALEYSLSRLHQLKKDATTMHLRTRSLNEMRLLHRSLDRALSTSMTRFKEIRDNLNKEYKQYVSKKTATPSANNSDDDDVEILAEDDDDPIYIDENSMESTQNDHTEVDLTAAGSCEFIDSSDKSADQNDASKDLLSSDPLNDDLELKEKDEELKQKDEEPKQKDEEPKQKDEESIPRDEDSNQKDEESIPRDEDSNQKDEEPKQNNDDSNQKDAEPIEKNVESNQKNEDNEDNTSVDKQDGSNDNENVEEETKSTDNDKNIVDENDVNSKEGMDCDDKENDESHDGTSKEGETNNETSTMNGQTEKMDVSENEKDDKIDEENVLDENSDSEKKIVDTEMSEEMIEDLLKDDNAGNEVDAAGDGKHEDNIHSLDVSDDIQDVIQSEKD